MARNETAVSENSDGYYRTRIPKALGDAMDLGGATLKWEVDSSKSFKVRVLDDD